MKIKCKNKISGVEKEIILPDYTQDIQIKSGGKKSVNGYYIWWKKIHGDEKCKLLTSSTNINLNQIELEIINDNNISVNPHNRYEELEMELGNLRKIITSFETEIKRLSNHIPHVELHVNITGNNISVGNINLQNN